MQKIGIKLTVYFEDSYWIGIVELEEKQKVKVSRIIFGKEPKDYEVYEYLKENYNRLIFSKDVEKFVKNKRIINPKRLQRTIRKEVENKGIGTKSQQALKLLQEEKKKSRKKSSRVKKIEDKLHKVWDETKEEKEKT